VSTEMPASLRQRACGGLAGSSRRAAKDNQAATLGRPCVPGPARCVRPAAPPRCAFCARGVSQLLRCFGQVA
jgi:hypothetical protein